MAKAAGIDGFVKKSKFVINRSSERKASIEGEFVFKTLRLTISGELDLATGKLDTLKQRLTWGAAPIYDLTRVSSNNVARVEYRFGKGTEGVRLLVLNNERVGPKSLITGYADGEELLPHVNPGGNCGCADDNKLRPSRPLLAWDEAPATRPVTLKLSTKMAPELEGLAAVIPAVAAEISGGGGLGDWLPPGMDWVFCFLQCVAGFIWCVIKSIFLPRSEIFVTLCFVTNGDCYEWCSFMGGIG